MLVKNHFVAGTQVRHVAERQKLLARSKIAEKPPVTMLGVSFDNVTLSETITCIESMVKERKPCYLVTVNVDFLLQGRRDPTLRCILNEAHLVLCDGMPLVWASKWLGNPLPERVAGSDLVPEIIRIAAKQNYRLFFLGAAPDANAQAITNIQRQFPNLSVAGFSPPFRSLTGTDNEEIVRQIRAHQPDILLVAFGCPKAEKWMADNLESLGVPVIMGVGGTIDILAGRVRRAPPWMQRAGIEWFFRLCQEPRRLFRRYVADLWYFGWSMALELWRQKSLPHRKLHHSGATGGTV